MAEQLLLFDLGPEGKASRTDRKMAQSGQLTDQRKVTLDALRRCNGATHGELGGFMGCDWLVAAGCLRKLEGMGLVRKGEPRTCRVMDCLSTTWWLMEG